MKGERKINLEKKVEQRIHKRASLILSSKKNCRGAHILTQILTSELINANDIMKIQEDYRNALQSKYSKQMGPIIHIYI